MKHQKEQFLAAGIDIDDNKASMADHIKVLHTTLFRPMGFHVNQYH